MVREALVTSVTCTPPSAPPVRFQISQLSMVPKTTVAIGDESVAKKVVRLVEGLEDNDDVQDVYANFDIPEAILEAVAM